MKRYLVGEIYTDEDFIKSDTESFLDVNYQRLCAILLKKLESKMQTTGKAIRDISGISEEFLGQLEKIPVSLEGMFDIWNEIFLKMLYISNEKERLFPEVRKIPVHSKEWNLELSNEDFINQMKTTINNRKKPEATNEDKIFDLEEFKSTKKDVEIKIYGAEIVRLWFGKSYFRSLFIVTETRHEKYDPQLIVKNLRENVSREDSYIILEKLVGLHFGFCLQLFIVERFHEIEYQQIEEIINILSKYEGINGRINILNNIGEELAKCSNAEQKSRKIKACCKCLKILIPIFQELYVDTVDLIIDEYRKYYSYDTIVELVGGKRQDLHYYKKAKNQVSVSVHENYYGIGKAILDIEQKIADQKDSANVLDNVKDTLLPMKDYFDYLGQRRAYYERLDGIFQLPEWWEQLENIKWIDKIQAQIIKKSYEKYSGRI